MTFWFHHGPFRSCMGKPMDISEEYFLNAKIIPRGYKGSECINAVIRILGYLSTRESTVSEEWNDSEWPVLSTSRTHTAHGNRHRPWVHPAKGPRLGRPVAGAQAFWGRLPSGSPNALPPPCPFRRPALPTLAPSALYPSQAFLPIILFSFLTLF